MAVTTGQMLPGCSIISMMISKNDERARAKAALGFIIPILETYGFRWVITGGFACYAYGVDRLLTDIDIDIETDKDSAEFKTFLEQAQPYVSQPLEHFVDDNYDNFNLELTYQGQIIDICPMANLMIFDAGTKRYEPFYANGFPPIEQTEFEGFTLPLLSKPAIIDNKEMLQAKDEWQLRDIRELRKLLPSNG